MSKINEKLVIGTAQFGMDYGIKNKSGMVNINEIKHILRFARSNKVMFLDTAISYGESQKRLGQSGSSKHEIITKITSHDYQSKDIKRIMLEETKKSISLLQNKKLYGLLLHNGNDLLGRKSDDIYEALINCKKNGLVKKIGISAYESKEILAILKNYELDIIQMPFNILNRDLEVSGLLKKLKDKGVEIHVRSIFLQGLLLMKTSNMPSYFQKWNNLWNEWNQWLDVNEIDPVEACLKFVLRNKEIDKIIVGIDNLQQFKEILEISNKETDYSIPTSLFSNDKKLINPSFWK